MCSDILRLLGKICSQTCGCQRKSKNQRILYFSPLILSLSLQHFMYLSCDSCSLCMQLAHLVEMEVKHRCNQILELGFPLGGLAKLFAQDWEGDVTVVMPATLAQVCTKKVYSFSRILVWERREQQENELCVESLFHKRKIFIIQVQWRFWPLPMLHV